MTSAVHGMHDHAHGYGECDGQTNEANVVDEWDDDFGWDGDIGRTQIGSRRRNGDDTCCCMTEELWPSFGTALIVDLNCKWNGISRYIAELALVSVVKFYIQ